MSEARKGKKQNPFQGRLEAQLKSKSASLPTPLDYGGAGNAVKGRDERQLRAPLTAFPAPVPPSVLTTAVVVILRNDACGPSNLIVDPEHSLKIYATTPFDCSSNPVHCAQ